MKFPEGIGDTVHLFKYQNINDPDLFIDVLFYFRGRSWRTKSYTVQLQPKKMELYRGTGRSYPTTYLDGKYMGAVTKVIELSDKFSKKRAKALCIAIDFGMFDHILNEALDEMFERFDFLVRDEFEKRHFEE
jgi:hypothetical protein